MARTALNTYVYSAAISTEIGSIGATKKPVPISASTIWKQGHGQTGEEG